MRQSAQFMGEGRRADGDDGRDHKKQSFGHGRRWTFWRARPTEEDASSRPKGPRDEDVTDSYRPRWLSPR